MTAALEGEPSAWSSVFSELIDDSQAVILVQWFQRWHNVKKVFPLAVKKAQALVCIRASLFNVYTWLALAYVLRLIHLHV